MIWGKGHFRPITEVNLNSPNKRNSPRDGVYLEWKLGAFHGP